MKNLRHFTSLSLFLTLTGVASVATAVNQTLVFGDDPYGHFPTFSSISKNIPRNQLGGCMGSNKFFVGAYSIPSFTSSLTNRNSSDPAFTGTATWTTSMRGQDNNTCYQFQAPSLQNAKLIINANKQIEVHLNVGHGVFNANKQLELVFTLQNIPENFNPFGSSFSRCHLEGIDGRMNVTCDASF